MLEENAQTEIDWRLVREEFPVAARMAYLNSAGAGPVSRRTLAAARQFYEETLESGDVYFDIERGGRLPDYRKLPEDVRPGELLALLNTGAYTVAQMFPYNGRPLPAVVLVRESGSPELIRRRDTYEDLLANEVW